MDLIATRRVPVAERTLDPLWSRKSREGTELLCNCRRITGKLE